MDLPLDLFMKVIDGLLMDSVLRWLALDSFTPSLIQAMWHLFHFRWLDNSMLSVSERRIPKCWMNTYLNAFIELMLVLLKLDSQVR